MHHKYISNSLYKSTVTDMFSERFLVFRAKRKDKEAFAKLYLKHFDSIYRYIFFRVGQDRELAEDLTQDVFYKAWEKIHSLGKKGINIRAWIFRIAHNLVIDHYRSDKSNVRLKEYLPDDKDTYKEALKIIEKDELIKAIDKLSDVQKEIVIMKFIEGFSNKEISQVLKKKEDAIRAIQSRAFKNLKILLSNL